MKYQSSNTRLIYDFDFSFKNKKPLLCPECSSDRNKSNKKDLRYYESTNRAHCFHCRTTFFEYKPFKKQKDYIVPEWKNITKLTDKAVKWFTGRMISQQTLNLMQVYSDKEWMPQFNKEVEVICFPYFIDGKLINIKFRGANKSFKMISGAELVFYNFDALKDNTEIIICEGEIDALTWLENGFLNILSVPNGAGNTEYIDSSIDAFDNIEKIYLSTDVDNPGLRLRDDLIQRFGADRCYLIDFKQHKDANDYFINEGGIEFKDLLKNARKVPVSGIIRISDIHDQIYDFYQKGHESGLTIDSVLDNSITWELRRVLIVNGIPGHGKSEFVDFLVSKLNLKYGWKGGFFTPENYPLEYHYAKLHSKFSGKKFIEKTDTTDFYYIRDYINDNFFYIIDEEDFTLDFVLNRAKILIKQYGIKIFVIDPYNKLDHQYESNISETQYISKFLDKITTFAKYNNLLFILVTHPRKMEPGKVPNMYDISGSAHWYNKPDYGITIYRTRDNNNNFTNQVDIHVQKVKFKHLGEPGLVEMNYNYNNGRYEDFNYSIDIWDNTNWLDAKEQLHISSGIEPEFNSNDEQMPF